MEDDGYDTAWPPLGEPKRASGETNTGAGETIPPPDESEDRAVELRPEDVWVDHYSVPGGPPILGWFPPQRCPS